MPTYLASVQLLNSFHQRGHFACTFTLDWSNQKLRGKHESHGWPNKNQNWNKINGSMHGGKKQIRCSQPNQAALCMCLWVLSSSDMFSFDVDLNNWRHRDISWPIARPYKTCFHVVKDQTLHHPPTNHTH